MKEEEDCVGVAWCGSVVMVEVVVVFLRAVVQWVPPLTPPKGPRNPIKTPHRSPGPSRSEGKGKVGPSVSRQGIGIQFWRRLGAS